MKKITRSSLVIALLFCLTTHVLFSQCAYKEISLAQQVHKSSLVVEGKVVSKKSFWDDNRQNIYTVNTVEVYKIFKGDNSITKIEVITLGGVVGTDALIVSPGLKLRQGDIGVFTLYENKVPLSSLGAKSINKKFRPYSSLQGFYKYDLYNNVAVNPFNKKKDISNSFYNEIMSHTKSNYKKVVDFNTKGKSAKSLQAKGALVPTSITFSPTTATAGTQTVLTISGSGFGASQGASGKVSFANADDGGTTFIDALSTQVLTWSDTEITVEIPSQAGTGKVRVTNDDTTTGDSAADLTITYAQLNAVSDFYSVGGATDYAYGTRHINENGSGGYTWEMHTPFFDDSEEPGARAAFESALDKWRCESNINWTVSGTATAVDVAASDGTNVVRFDNGAELDAGVLGRCSSWWAACGSPGTPSSASWHVAELDIVFDDGTDWYFGAGLPALLEFDFESVALHELGHGHQLAHVIDPVQDGDNSDDVMQFAISNSEQQRVLLASNISAANDVQSRSTSVVACGVAVMTNSSTCNLSLEENQLSAVLSIFPNPSKEQFQIDASYIELEKASIYDVSGREISTHDLRNTPRVKTINMTNVSSGIYFLNVYSENAMVTKKIVVD